MDVPSSWMVVAIEELLAPLDDGRLIHHGWSPQCEKEPSESDDVWGVLKTTAIQPGAFLAEHNKRLPDKLKPRPMLEVRTGDVIVTSAGPRARCGVACLVRRTRPRLMLSGKMYRIRFNDSFVDSGYIEAYLVSETARRAIDGMKTGISDSGLNLTHGRFRQLRVPLAPLNEQRRIVAAIEGRFSRLDAADGSLVAALRRLEAFVSQTVASAFRDDWEVVPLREVTESQVYGTSAKASVGPDGVPVLRMGNINGGKLDFRDLKYLPTDHPDVEKLALEPGDLLFNRTNSPELVGKSAVFTASEQMTFASYLIRVRLSGRCDPHWAALVINGPPGRKYIASVRSQQVGQANVNGTKLAALPIPVPPLKEQRRIVAEVVERLSRVEAMRASIERAQRRSAALRAAILERAFRGELVPQDPADEPAEGLLVCIRAGRDAADAAPGRRRVRA